MGKTFKKSQLKEYVNNEEIIDEEELNELIDIDGGLISYTNNYNASDKVVKSKNTSRDHARKTSQGPGSYYPWGGAFYGGYYTMNEDEDLFDEDELSPIKKYSREKEDSNRRKALKFAKKDITKHYHKPKQPDYDLNPSEDWASYALPYDTDFNFDIYETELKKGMDYMSEEKMKSLVDEMLSKKKQYGIVKRTNEQDVIEDMEIPELSELKTKYENPIISRKILYLTDLINKHDVSGDEIAIIFNHLIDNLNVNKINDDYRKILCDKLSNGEEE